MDRNNNSNDNNDNSLYNEWIQAINNEQQTDQPQGQQNNDTNFSEGRQHAVQESLMLPPAPVAAAAILEGTTTTQQQQHQQQQSKRSSPKGMKRTSRSCSTTGSRIKRQRSEQSIGSAASNESSTPVVITQNPTLTGRPPTMLYLSADFLTFSPYQIMIRKHVEFFEATAEEVAAKSPMGGARAIVLGQVGVRCRFCGALPPNMRASGAVIYPSKRSGVYQAAQNIANSHWWEHCGHLPLEIRAELMQLKNASSSATGAAAATTTTNTSSTDKQQLSTQRASKATWSDRATALGVYEDQYGLRFAERINALGFPSG